MIDKQFVLSFLNNPQQGFAVKNALFCGIEGRLVFPFAPVVWNEQNIIFRSSIWDNGGNLLSGGFKKFVNIGENDTLFPPPTNINNCHIINKIDGSLLLCDHVNDSFSMRTRGTVSYQNLDNYQDFEWVQNNSLIQMLCNDYPHRTWLFEIVTPNNKIVIDYGNQIKVYLIGSVDKRNYTILNQHVLDAIAQVYNFERPHYYKVDSLDSLVEVIRNTKDIEGACIYHNDDQNIHKLKSQWYLDLHRNMSQLPNIKSVVQLYSQYDFPTVYKFLKTVEDLYDYEVAKRVENDVIKTANAGALAYIKYVDNVVVPVKQKVVPLSTRKDQALYIINNFTELYKTLAFNVLSGKQLSPNHREQMILNELSSSK